MARGPEAARPELLGLVTLYDPPRPDAKQLIAALRDLGVSVKMLTGDALPVAREIAQGVGLANIRRVADLKAASAQAGHEAVDLLAGADGLAEVYPEDKYLVVQDLQAGGHVTGMTGDGVNDAPALRQAEVGIAVASATDVAKGAASVVLTEPGLTNIVALVEQGRTIYQRILTWILNKISRTILKAAFVAIAFVLTGKFVVSAFAMLLLVFMTDFAKIALATDEVRWSQKAGDLEHREFHRDVGGAGCGDGGGDTPALVPGVVTFRFGDERPCSAHVQLSDAALLCRVLDRVRQRATLVLGDETQQDPGGGPDGGRDRRHRRAVHWPPWHHHRYRGGRRWQSSVMRCSRAWS